MSEYISREAVDDMIYDYSRSCDVNYGQLSERLYSIPSADVRENIHARWESDGHGHIICTACKGANVSTWKSRFCPMCGARMDEVKHDE